MRIPKAFKIRHKTFSVKRVDALPMGDKGRANIETKVIRLARRGKILGIYTKHTVAGTFWHEVMHVVLHDMGHYLWDDEDFVENVAKRINQVVHTAEF